MMTPEEIAYLKSLPECVEVDFAGRRRPWLLGDEAFAAAEREGIPLPVLLGADLAQTDPGTVERLTTAVRFVALRLWAGFQTFHTDEDPAPSLRFVRSAVTIHNHNGLIEQMAAALPPVAEGVEVEEVGKPEGRPTGGRKAKTSP